MKWNVIILGLGLLLSANKVFALETSACSENDWKFLCEFESLEKFESANVYSSYCDLDYCMMIDSCPPVGYWFLMPTSSEIVGGDVYTRWKRVKCDYIF